MGVPLVLHVHRIFHKNIPSIWGIPPFMEPPICILAYVDQLYFGSVFIPTQRWVYVHRKMTLSCIVTPMVLVQYWQRQRQHHNNLALDLVLGEFKHQDN